MNKFRWMIVSLGLGLTCPVQAADGLVVESGGSPDASSLRVGAIRQWNQRWFTEGHWHLTGYWEAAIGAWQADDHGGAVLNASLTPVFRFRPNASGGTQPYWDAGIGVMLLSKTRVGPDVRLGSAFQFNDVVGFGVTFGDKSQYDLGYRFQHVSNADIARHNDGIDFHQIRLTYLY